MSYQLNQFSTTTADSCHLMSWEGHQKRVAMSVSMGLVHEVCCAALFLLMLIVTITPTFIDIEIL